MTGPDVVDAVVVGAGPNGLVAANVLADAGWSVTVLEAEPDPGGAVRSAELTRPGFVHDRFSAFYPLGIMSPAIRGLGLERHGLRWRRAPLVLAHPTTDGGAAVLSTDIAETAASLDAYAPGDGDAWRRLEAPFARAGRELVDTLMSPFPPWGAAVALARALGPRGLAALARLGPMSVAHLTGTRFAGDGGRLLVAGNTLHTDLGLGTPGGGFMGWLLAAAGQEWGFPVPEGGAGALTAALVHRLEGRGGTVVCNTRVERVDIRHGRAAGVSVAGGGAVAARRAVLADVAAPALYRRLVGADHTPARVRLGLRRFRWDHATVKVDWALSETIPWRAVEARRAGTVHIGDSMDRLGRYATAIANGRIPSEPFVIMGQMTTTDPTRSPAGTETAWAYTHVPQGVWRPDDEAAVVDGIERAIETHAPGFRALVLGRCVTTPPMLQAADANLVGGAVNGGTARLGQQLFLRPVPGLAGPSTGIPGLYLASASAHPGGGVHGACGANAARAALSQFGVKGPPDPTVH